MRHRIYTPEAIVAGSEIAVTGDELHHAARAVRIREGERVELFDGRGRAAEGVVVRLEREALTVRVETPLPSRESPLALTLAMSIIQLDKFELVLQKATELGVRTIVPLVADRVEVRPERYRGKADRWEKIVFEAVKQCGRAVIPRLDAPATFEEVLRRDGTKTVFDADEPETVTPPDAENDGEPPERTLLVGPEGGFSERELALARDRGCRFERLGPRRLRAETAAIVACVVAAGRHGDLRR